MRWVDMMSLLWFMLLALLPVVPHKAVAEVSE